jgi:hypothetical protein
MYKIVQNDKVIDVVSYPYFVKFTPAGHIVVTDASSAEGIVGSDEKTIYSFRPVNIKRVSGVVSIIKLETLEEFNRLKDLLNSNQEISADESALAEAKKDTISRLSSICKNLITAGFSIKLSDGCEHHFKLTTEDQLNLMMIENQINAGVETFIYHATEEPCKFFSRDDMIRIIKASNRFTLYHTTYFNAAKQYIKTLTSIDEVRRFAYGMDVSSIIDDVVLKQILKNGGSVE